MLARTIAPLIAALSALAAAPRSVAACEPARVTSDLAPLPPAWRRALDDLVLASAREGFPWSCGGAEITLELVPHGARLTVSMRGFPVQAREVAAPEDLVPTGKALLARPDVTIESVTMGPQAAPNPGPAKPGPVTVEPVAIGPHAAPNPGAPVTMGPQAAPNPGALRAPDAADREPRLLIDVLASTRWSDRADAFWLGAALRATLPVDAWRLGIWARFEMAVAELAHIPVDFSMTSGSLGFSGGYRFLAAPIDLTATLEPALAVVAMDGGVDTPKSSAEGTKLDFRLGARLQGAIPFDNRFRGIFALDGEISPVAMASTRHSTIDPRLPLVPSFTLGASLGIEVVIR